jgi:Cu/Ag efflux protein CusF
MRLVQTVALAAALLFVTGSASALAQEQNLAQGEIVRVDTADRTVVIRTDTGSHMRFTYNDDTVVKGADDTISGLGTREGMLVSITYERQETKLVAKEIAVQKVDEAPPKKP